MFSILRGTRATSLALAGMALASLLSVPLRAADPDFITAVTTTNPVAFYQLNATSGKSEVGSTTYKSRRWRDRFKHRRTARDSQQWLCQARWP